MFKKSLLAVCFIITAVMLSGCNSKTKAPEAAPEGTPAAATAPAVQENVDYIVTTEIPTASYEGIKDEANPAFIKILPHFNGGKYPAGKGKITWFKTGLGSKIPAFRNGKLLEVINTDKDFIAFIGNVDEKMFEQYFNDVADANYLFEGPTAWDNMNLYNDKYAINLRFCQEGTNVTTVRARVLNAEEQKKAKAALEARSKAAMEAQAMKKVEDAKKEAAKADAAKKEPAKTEPAKK